MRRVLLLGNADTKRTVYLKKAAAQMEIPVELQEWKDWNGQLPEGELFLKIDPPLWESWSLKQLRTLTESYRRHLTETEQAAENRHIEFFNTPSVISELLDKCRCKKRLIQAGLPVTELLCENNESDPAFDAAPDRNQKAGVQSTEQLLERMRQRKISQVFVKPVSGSGAAGVSAFRIQPGTGRMSLYTCAYETSDTGLANTKKLRQYTDPKKAVKILDKLFELDCIVERWYPKAAHNGYTYDLRVVLQEQRIDYVLARLSKGPITNLHLNNHPLSVEELNLPARTVESVEELCRMAADCFPGLRCAGIDILLEKGSLKPRIIEMNAQGDLIYQDIYHENIIYRRQAERMKAWLSSAYF